MNHPNNPALVLLKLGGSLLDLPEFCGLVRKLITMRPEPGVLLVVGGGRTADLVRDWDRTHQLGEEAAHWLALDAMRLNERLVSQLIPELRAVRNARQVAAAVADRVPALLCTDCFVRWGESAGHPPLPRTWQTTSDSIAAWSATLLAAEELILVKSVPLPNRRSLEEAAEAGFVDPLFPSFARKIPRIRWINGRAQPPVIEPWYPFEPQDDSCCD
jgi:5-(aminomethyl)-3-furanmethanol phosphate kinase